MNINLELIDELRKRANVSYEEAKAALEKCNGNILEALVYLEKQNKVKSEEDNSLLTKMKKLLAKGNSTKFIVKKKENIAISVPVTLAGVVTVVAPHITILSLGIALIAGYRIKFEGKNGENMKVNKTFDKISVAVDTAKKKLTEDDASK
ncbi:hypothetical protein CPJCM30710_14410 [Clostridium polyendosporum]|uniref:DUF4342 domain-containing protein n=1 Tax=Clostridium polyendosporum TaxID=69208 RepID=A0A919RYC1_9CLOT|nr:DUF4342 domain-containing protein [Clostridium polyendosporum]GIM28775.1 hypothetical protein CPJCM30710_14410 [Clostridium polyendosporum]